MIYAISQELATELKAQGCPLPVVYGPERMGATGAALTTSRILIERDRDVGDKPGPGRARNANPRMVAIRAMGAVCRIFAQSTLTGARVQDHERLADLALDKIEVALYKVVTKRSTQWRISSAKLLGADELALRGIEVWTGVVYEMRFSVDRAVNDTTWAEVADAEATVGTAGLTIETTDAIKLTNGPVGASPEIAC